MKEVPRWAEYLRFRDAFRAAMDERLYPAEWLDRRVLSGDVLFLSTQDAAIVAEVRTYPSGAQDVHGLVAAGAMDEIVERLIPEAEAWGRAQGCAGAIIESREGWARALRRYGYEPFQTAVRKEFA